MKFENQYLKKTENRIAHYISHNQISVVSVILRVLQNRFWENYRIGRTLSQQDSKYKRSGLLLSTFQWCIAARCSVWCGGTRILGDRPCSWTDPLRDGIGFMEKLVIITVIKVDIMVVMMTIMVNVDIIFIDCYILLYMKSDSILFCFILFHLFISPFCYVSYHIIYNMIWTCCLSIPAYSTSRTYHWMLHTTVVES
jgi:hypothetical protein